MLSRSRKTWQFEDLRAARPAATNGRKRRRRGAWAYFWVSRNSMRRLRWKAASSRPGTKGRKWAKPAAITRSAGTPCSIRNLTTEPPPFPSIVVTAAPSEIPQPLLDQLAVGGRLVITVGLGSQDLVVVTRTEEGYVDRVETPVRFVPMTGKAEQ